MSGGGPPTIDPMADVATRLRGRDLLLAVAEGTAGAVGDEFLRGLVETVAEAFGAKLAMVCEPVDAQVSRVRAVAGFYDGAPVDDGFEYDTDGTPCALAVENAFVRFPDGIAERFPKATPALAMGLDSYLAICLRAADSTHLGHLALMDSRRMEVDDEDIAALRIFASRAAAELERRRQAKALEASRERVIEAADAERQRIGRDLHDGAQQRLMAVANFLKVAQRRAGEDAPVLELAAEELAAANAELRQLARGVFPVALAERGLCGAIQAVAEGCSVPVECDFAEVDVPERIALAAYFVVCEALTNVVRYSRAGSARVSVRAQGGGLQVEVSDDGVGGADVAGGTGLRGLMERVQILGGSLTVDSPAGGGTRVSAWLPT
jgi:signal transduction histidine kinase